MRRYIICLLIGILAISGCERQDSTPDETVIGIVNLTPTVADTIQGFKEGLADYGYTESENTRFVYDGPALRMEALDEKINAVLSQKPDLILSLLTPVTVKLKAATANSDVPIVFGPVGDPLATNIVDDLKTPGGNITGVRVTNTSEKALEWFTRLVPELDTLLVPFNPDSTAMVTGLSDLKKVAEILNIQLLIKEVRNGTDLSNAFSNIPSDVDGAWVLGAGFWAPYVDQFIQLAMDNRLPLKGSTSAWCKKGAFFSYAENLYLLGKQQARMAASILNGASPGSLPVEIADFYLSINPDTARQIGLQISESMLKQADYIIQTQQTPEGE